MTLVELLCVITVIVLLIGMMLPRTPRHGKAVAARIKCVNNLKQVGLAFRIWSEENEHQFPFAYTNATASFTNQTDAVRHFLWLTNKLSTPQILHCPVDSERKAVKEWASFSPSNLSYFVGLVAEPTNYNKFLAGDRNLMVNSQPVQQGLLNLTSKEKIEFSRSHHNTQGMVLMADGSVQQYSNSRFREGISNAAPQIILIP